MAFSYSVAPTAGVGTISIAKGSTTVTGVGTNFTSPALGGQLIIVNGFTARVLNVANATTMTINRAPTYAITEETFQRNANFNILATGTETSLAGLADLAGVTVTQSGTQLVYDLGVQKLIVSGAGASLSWNALTECLVFAPEVVEPELTINVGTTVNITGNRTDGTYTAPFYPRALGMPRVGTVAGTTFNPIFRSIVQNGTFTLDGVWIDNNVVTEMTSGTTITNSKWTNTNQGANFRTNSTNININGLALHRANLTLTINTPDTLNGIEFYDSHYVPNSLPAVAPANPRIYTDWNFLGATPFMNNFSGNANYVEFVNLGDWDGFRLASNANVQMAVRLVKALSLSVIDSLSSGIDNAIIYRLDTNNGNRGTFYTADEHLILNTASGTANGKVLAQVGRLPAGAAFNSTIYTATMDFRNAANNATGNDILRYASYDHLLSSRAINTKGTGALEVEQTLFDDPNVTLDRADAIAKLASSFTVDPVTKIVTVTANSSFDDLYDALKAYKATANAINLSTPNLDSLILTPSGSELLAFNGWALIVNSGVTLSAGLKFNYVKFDTVTVNGTITGVYADSAGTSTVLQINPPSDDYSLCIFKADGTTKFFQSGVDAGSYYVFFAPNEAGTYFLAAEKYGQRRTDDTLVLNGGNVWYNITDQEDVGITDDFATASAYTTLSTTSQIYDATAVFRLTEAGIKLGQLVARDGLYLDFGNNNVKIQDDASAIVSVASGTITYKSIVINSSDKYNAMKATPPKTITPTDTEIINVLIEDANGDSQLSILGGDNLGYELWKVTTVTATDDYETGTLLTTLSTNAAPYRFIGVSGFDIVGRDVSSGVRRRSSMLKGTYTQAFYVGDQIQLATNAPQLIENNEKLDELILKVDTNLDVAVSTRLADADYIEPDNTTIGQIKTKVDTLENTDLTGIALEATNQEILTAIDNIPATDLTSIETDLEIINKGVQDASLLIPHTTDL
jgi:hypothetical protein